jgi:hypothetical protein
MDILIVLGKFMYEESLMLLKYNDSTYTERLKELRNLEITQKVG